MRKKKINKNNFKRIKNRIDRSRRHDEASSLDYDSFNAHCKSDKFVVIYKSELDFISRCILDCKNIETGGQLFGFYTAKGIPIVCYALGPGKNANHQMTFFNQDLDYLESVGGLLLKDYALQHIGEWHSHHRLGLDHPSGHDAANIRGNVDRLGLPQFLLCIGICDGTSSTLNAFDFIVGERGYCKLPWMIKNTDSPYRSAIDNAVGQLIRQPVTKVGKMCNMLTINKRPDYTQGYWLNKKGNDLVLKFMLEKATAVCGAPPKVVMDIDKCVHLIINMDGNDVDICFCLNFPQESPKTTINGQCVNNAAAWHYKGDIQNAFSEYLMTIKSDSYDDKGAL